jgi:FtsP/CotA-like multicopper oxidase with cupredoxin domain
LRAQVVGAPVRVLAADGSDVNGPEPVSDRSVAVPAGGRADLGFTVPADGEQVLVQLAPDGAVGLRVGPADGAAPDPVAFGDAVDLLSYGRSAPLAFDPTAADRSFTYDIGRRPAFRDGVPGLQWSVNGRTFPDVPMLVVREGEVVRVRLHNGSGERHPMHPHGHHVVVLSRDGVAASGSPWVVDSLDVEPGETYEVAFVADNPGVWAFHCHKLAHAADGLVGHLAYEGVSTPYLVGGPAGNEPE